MTDRPGMALVGDGVRRRAGPATICLTHALQEPSETQYSRSHLAARPDNRSPDYDQTALRNVTRARGIEAISVVGTGRLQRRRHPRAVHRDHALRIGQAD